MGRTAHSSVWLLTLSAACGPATRLPASPVMQVNLLGANKVDPDEITEGLANHPPDGWPIRTYAGFDPLQLTIDRQRILGFYHARGFYAARLEDVEVLPSADGVDINYSIFEGPAFTIRSIRITGAPTDPPFDPSLPLARGDIFQYDAYEDAKTALTRRLVQAGYAHAQVDGRVEVYRHDAEVAVNLDLAPGPVVRFGEVRIDPGPLPESAVRARLAFEPGDVYDPDLLALTEARIYELGLVGVVTFYLPTDRNRAVMDVGIRIRPGPKNELRLGAGIGRQTPNYQTRFRIGYERRDFFNPQIRVATEVRPAVVYRPSQRRFAYGVEWSASITREDLFAARLLGQAQVQYNLLQYEAYATLGPAVRLVADRPWLDDRIHLSLGAHLKVLGFPRIAKAIPQTAFPQIGLPQCRSACQQSGTPGGLTLVYLEPSVTFDGRDDPVDPKYGVYARVHLELGHTLNGPGVAWIRLTPELRTYVSLGTPRVVLATRARLGAKLLPGAPIPATQRYFGGGSESQRGFTIRQLSPAFGRGDEAVPVGGEALFELSSEVRFHVARIFGMWFGLVGFIDAADVQDSFGQIEWLRPHAATGGGLRLFTPIGPVRFDVGYRLNRVAPDIEPGGHHRLAFHLSLGEAF